MTPVVPTVLLADQINKYAYSLSYAVKNWMWWRFSWHPSDPAVIHTCAGRGGQHTHCRMQSETECPGRCKTHSPRFFLPTAFWMWMCPARPRTRPRTALRGAWVRHAASGARDAGGHARVRMNCNAPCMVRPNIYSGRFRVSTIKGSHRVVLCTRVSTRMNPPLLGLVATQPVVIADERSLFSERFQMSKCLRRQ